MSASGAAPSPWGEPARTPPPTDHTRPAKDNAARATQSDHSAPAPHIRAATGARIPTSTSPIRTAFQRWEHPTGRERARAALTMVFVAIILGAAAATVLGIGVWVLAAFFHHAASG